MPEAAVVLAAVVVAAVPEAAVVVAVLAAAVAVAVPEAVVVLADASEHLHTSALDLEHWIPKYYLFESYY